MDAEFSSQSKEKTMHPMCIKLVALVLDLHTVEVFRDIRNNIRNFLEYDKHIKLYTSHWVSHTLIEIDLKDNFVKVMEIEKGSWCFVHNHLDNVWIHLSLYKIPYLWEFIHSKCRITFHNGAMKKKQWTKKWL